MGAKLMKREGSWTVAKGARLVPALARNVAEEGKIAVQAHKPSDWLCI